MYDSPITLFETFDTVVSEVTKKHNKTVMAEIQTKIGIDIDEKALTQALIQDKERYQEAYRKGYQDGKCETEHGHWEGKADISFLFDEKEFYNALNERLSYRANHTEDEYFEHFATFTCSVCGAKSGIKKPYCSECGAKMDEEINDDEIY